MSIETRGWPQGTPWEGREDAETAPNGVAPVPTTRMGKSTPSRRAAPRTVTCARCGVSWRNIERDGHCSGCHRTFRGLGAFDDHFRGDDRHCTDPATRHRKDGSPMWRLIDGTWRTTDVPPAGLWRAVRAQNPPVPTPGFVARDTDRDMSRDMSRDMRDAQWAGR